VDAHNARVDVAVIGAGIIGCSAAAFLAEAGAGVVVVERDRIGAGASGRNSGVLQDPLDERLTDLHHTSLQLYRELDGLELADEPDGILVLGATSADLPPHVAAHALADAREVEPLLRRPTPAVRIDTGWIVGPERATQAWADRAKRAGARFVTGDEPPPHAQATLRATGAWTGGVRPLWGVTARVPVRGRHVLEQAGVQDIVGGASGTFFTLVGDVLGSSFHAERPDAEAVARRLAQQAEPFLGPLATTTARACPRPQSPDGLPLVGRLDERTWVCAGHGAWGISVGPATARMAARAILGDGEPPAELDPLRFSG
jgi:glycine/D-amino acid oxidase-like deaminating enzyme